MINIRKQLSIFLANRPGTLAEVCEHLEDKNINIMAMTVSDTVDHSVVRLLVDKPGEAIHWLEDKGLLVVENDVLAVRLENKPGTLAEIARNLANNDVNIEYAYCTGTPAQKEGLMIIRTAGPEDVIQLLKNNS